MPPLQGAYVSASDISAAMAQEAQRRYEEAVKEGAKAPKQVSLLVHSAACSPYVGTGIRLQQLAQRDGFPNAAQHPTACMPISHA